jgi:putative peptidoglycan lipid II flippase
MPTGAPSTKPSAARLEPEPSRSSSGALARSAASGSAATLASRVLGVVREQVLAGLFGASNEMDAYRIAFRVPNLLRDLFAEGVMSAAFVPTFTRRLTADGRESALRLGVNATNALLLITGALVVLGVIFAEPLVRLFVTDEYAAIPGKVALTVWLSRIMMPFLTFIALAAVAMGMLNSLHYFFIPALSPALFNVVSILSGLALVPVMTRFGQSPITAFAVGTVAGGFAQWAVQWPLLRREGFAYRPTLDRRDEGLRRMLLLMGPGTFGLAATQVNLLVSSYLASRNTGVVSALEWAFRLMYLPIGLFGVSIAAATLPAASRRFTEKDTAGVRTTVADGLSLMFMMNIPAAIGLFVLAAPIVQLIYERGRFTAAHTAMTAGALKFYAIGLVGYSIVRIVSPVFYALGANRTPVAVSMMTVLLNAMLSVLLVRTRLDYLGLPLATSAAALFNATVLMFLLRGRLQGLEGRRLAGSVVRIAVAGVLMGAVAAGADVLLIRLLPGSAFPAQITRLGLAIGAALLTLTGAAYVLRIREFHHLVDAVARRLRRSAR